MINDIPYADIDTLFLDVGNTLISMNFAWIVDELAARKFFCDVPTLRRAEAAARPIISAELGHQSTESKDVFTFYLETVLLCLPNGSDHDASRINMISRELTPILKPTNQAVRLWSSVIPGVPDSLTSLKKAGLQLVALSNSNGTVENMLIQQNLRSYLTAVYDSQLVGFEKPDPKIFHFALKDLNADPAHTLHVGDLYNIDMKGARAAGLHAVLIDPFDDWQNVDCKRVRDMTELSQRILAALGREKKP